VSNHSPWVRLAGCGLLLLAPSTQAKESKSDWTEVKFPHVTVKTDLGLEAAERAGLLAERMRAALIAAAWPGSKLPQDRVELVVFSSHQDFQHYFGELVGHKAVLWDYPPTVFLYGASERWVRRPSLEIEETTSPVKQALALHLATFFYRRQPRWFLVGLSQFLETLQIAADWKSAVLGQVNRVALQDYSSHRTLTVADALAWGSTLDPHDEGTVAALSGLSWLMVQWMFDVHQQEFVRFQKLLASGLDPQKAWKVVFPQPTADIDQELHHFAQYGPYGVATIALPEEEFTIDRERPMSAAEAHAVRATAALAADRPKEVLSEVTAALAEDSGNVTAVRLQMPLLKPAERPALARRATAAHPENGLAWLALGDALKEAGENSEESAQAYKKATELAPDHPAAFSALAAVFLSKGQPMEALPLALNAAKIAPWDAGYLDRLASALAGVGRCSEAVATEARAADMAADQGGAAKRGVYATRLGELQKTCTDATAAPADGGVATPTETKPGGTGLAPKP
jgi:tetratricopeptide (TPR) repeat protein